MASVLKDGEWVWLDGGLVSRENSSVSILSHSLHYGTAVFEGIRCYPLENGKSGIFRAKEHYERFLRSLRMLGYDTQFKVSDLVEASIACIQKNGFKQCYLRPIGFLGDETRGLALPRSPKLHIAIAAWEWGVYMGDKGQDQGIRICTSSYRRAEPGSSLPCAKTSGGYLLSVLARQEAERNGYQEGLLLDAQGYVAEGSGENIFIVRGKSLLTPPEGSILPGITRDCIFHLASKLGIPVEEKLFGRGELYSADEAFFTGTAIEVNPIIEVDNRKIGDGRPGPIFRELFSAFRKAVSGGAPEWISVV